MKNVLFAYLFFLIFVPFAGFSQNVGIGVTNPAAKFEIRGSSSILDNSLHVKDGLDNTLISVSNQGRLGINIQNPAVPLHVYSSFADEMVRIRGGFPYISFYKADVYSGYLWSNGLSFELGTPVNSGIPVTISPGLNVAATFLPTGSVGIGTTDPLYRLDVNGRMRLRHQGESAGIWFNNTTNSGMVGFEGVFSNQAMGWYGNTAGWSMLMNTNTGNVSIGTGSDVINARLEVRGTGSGSTALKLANGRLQYEGAGVNTATPVFVHKATLANAAGGFTYIDNPYCNNNPSAILIVTMNATYGSGTGGGYTDFPAEDPECTAQTCEPSAYHIFYNGPGNFYYSVAPPAARDKWCIRGYRDTEFGTFIADLTGWNFNVIIIQP
jgi:hypothetical protein